MRFFKSRRQFDFQLEVSMSWLGRCIDVFSPPNRGIDTTLEIGLVRGVVCVLHLKRTRV